MVPAVPVSNWRGADGPIIDSDKNKRGNLSVSSRSEILYHREVDKVKRVNSASHLAVAT
jgi:hypothetical protein